MVEVPSFLTTTDGTAPRGFLSVRLKRLRATFLRVGDEDGIRVDEVGNGVGSGCRSSNADRERLRALGSAGDEDRGSKAGSSDAADFFLVLVLGSAPLRASGVSIPSSRVV